MKNQEKRFLNVGSMVACGTVALLLSVAFFYPQVAHAADPKVSSGRVKPSPNTRGTAGAGQNGGEAVMAGHTGMYTDDGTSADASLLNQANDLTFTKGPAE